ncbi:MAG: sialate O-acetylesterase [Paludibacteraceae bacterium]
MRTKIVTLFFSLFCVVSSAFAVDGMTVTANVTAVDDVLEVRSFAVGVQLFTNRTNMPINTVPSGFEGYKMLSSGGGVEMTGTITASAAGQIYITARSTLTFSGWTKLTGYDYTYATTNTGMSIYYKDVVANEVVTLPTTTDFRGITPIAKNISIANQQTWSLDTMTVTVETADNFEKGILKDGATYYLNRTYTLYSVGDTLSNNEFLLSDAGTSSDGITHTGTIIPSKDGEIYVLGRTVTAISGWTLVPGTEFYYNAGSSIGAVSLFKKTVTAGQRIEIPAVDNFYETRPFAKSIILNKIIPADSMDVTVEVTEEDAGIFTKSTFNDGSAFFTNRTYTITNTPTSFRGFDFLANEGAKIDKGVVIPSKDGYVYVAAKPGGITGWTEIENSTFYYSTATPTDMSIYKKQVKAGERVELPLVTDFQGITPIAKNITLSVLPADKDARLSMIKVDGADIQGFMRETTDYEIMLPYTYDELPVVEPKTLSSSATYTIQTVEDVKGTEEERTATVNVKSADNSISKMYKVSFKVLPKLDLYLCIGQSNMAGYAPLDATKGDLNPMDNSYLFNTSNQFEQAVNPLNRYSTVAAVGSNALLGPSYSFAKSINMRSDTPIGLIVNARGGSSVENWTKGGTGSDKDTLYLPTMKRALEAKKWGDFKAIIWHQGEANKADAASYPAKLQQFVADLCSDLGNPNLLFVAGQIGTFGLNVTDFNNMISTISTFIPHSACASSDGLTNNAGDTNHFDRAGAITLGERYAKIVADSLYLPGQVVVKIEADAGQFTKKSLNKNIDLFLNRPTYLITDNTFSGFDNFEFLSSNAGEIEKGVMIPETSGKLYLIADKGLNIGGWTPVFGADIHYTGAELSIYSKNVTAGERVVIPEVTNFKGASPIAKHINLIEISPEKDARVDSIFVDGKYLKSFDKNVLSYDFYLPYTATTVPVITVKTHASGAIANVTNAPNINGSSVSDKTSVVQVTSQDGSTTLTYNIVFDVLPSLDLFLCIGQSNMAGAATLDASKGDYDPVSNAFLFNSDNAFEIAKNGMNRYANVLTSTSQYYGLTYQFAKKITAQTGKQIGLVVNARGGSSIELWDKAGTDAGDTLYSKTMERALEAQKWGKYKAILWHQGEANRTSVAAYSPQLIQLVSNLRIDLNEPDLYFVAGQIGQWRADNAPFNNLISTISTFINNSNCVSTDGLVNLTNLADDNSHFNRDGLATLGDRYAAFVLNRCYISTNVKKDNPNTAIVYSYQNKIFINCGQNDTNCAVFDVTGRKIYSEKINRNSVISLNQKGIYVVSLSNSTGNQKVKVILK